MNKMVLHIVVALSMCGCLSLNFGEMEGGSTDGKHEVVLLANSNNVYRLSEDTVLKVKVQQKNGRWSDSKLRVMVPADWYLVKEDAIDE